MAQASIHSTALVDPKAELGSDVTVGPFAIVEKGTCIGAGTVIESQAQILPGVSLGEDCRVGPGSILGGDPQSIGFDRSLASGIEIGRGNVFREHVTVHRSMVEGGATRIGDQNYFMTASHVGHDCEIGGHNVIANQCLLGGHVRLGDRCFLGGGTLIHQFIRIGDLVMTQGNSSLSQDVPPGLITSGLNGVIGLNVVGLRRAGVSAEDRAELKRLFRSLFHRTATLEETLKVVEKRVESPIGKAFVAFFREPSEKGICSRRREA